MSAISNYLFIYLSIYLSIYLPVYCSSSSLARLLTLPFTFSNDETFCKRGGGFVLLTD